MASVSRRRLLHSVSALSVATGLAGCGSSGRTDDRCGDEPPNETNRNVESPASSEIGSLPSSGWPQVGYDASNARYRSDATGVADSARLAWSKSFGRESATAPVVGDGVVYVVDEEGRLTGVDARTGKVIWRSSDASATGPVAFGGRIVYFGDEDGLHAVAADTRESRWVFVPPEIENETTPTGRPPNRVRTPTLTENVAYAALAFGDDRHVYAIDRETGDRRWRVAGQQVAAATNDAVFVHDEGDVVAVEADNGTTRWTASIHDGETVAVADDRVYGATDIGTVAAFDAASGEEQWTFEGENELLAPPSVSPDGVFVGTEPTEGNDGGNLYALDPESGELRWCSYLGAERVGSPAVTDETVFVPRSSGLLQARTVEDGSLDWQFYEEYADFAHVAVVGGTVFAGTTNGGLYALDSA